MKVIVIAAGDSKRLGEHTKNIPKAMVKIDDRRRKHQLQKVCTT